MSIYDLKPAFQTLLRPLSNALGRTGIPPNAITIAALVLSCIAGLTLLIAPTTWWALAAIPAALFVRMALNALDGMVARDFGRRTPLGGRLNEVGDVASDAALYLPFGAIAGASPMLVGLVVALAAVTEMSGVVHTATGGARRYDGPMGKSDRAAAFGLLATLLAVGVPAGPWINGVFAIIAVLACITAFRRVREPMETAI